MEAVKRTPLFETHRALGARMTEFAGFSMPLNYRGIIEEHRAVRSAAGLFDLSHMGEFFIAGRKAVALLERALTNSAAALVAGQAQYTIMCAHDGGALDDLIVYRLGADSYLLCVNAGNIAVDREWLLDLNQAIGAEFRDASDETAMLAIQGPRAAAIVEALANPPLNGLGRFRVAQSVAAGAKVIAARTGYTGEDGFELFVAAPEASALFHALLEASAGDGLVPCGLGARDTLRLEAGFALYGHELDRQTTPLEAGLGRYVKLGRDFIGGDALAAENRDGLRKRLIGIRTEDGHSVPRQGYRIFCRDGAAGVVTSGSYAPSLERPIAMGYVDSATPHALGDRLEVEIRGRRVGAEVVRMPFYRARRK